MILDKKPIRYKVHHFDYKERKHSIEQMAAFPNIFTLITAFHLPVDKRKWDVKKVSRVQKNLKQKLYNYLAANGYRTDNYILNIGAPTKATRGSIFIDMIMTAPVITDGDLASNEAFCKMFIDQLHQSFD